VIAAPFIMALMSPLKHQRYKPCFVCAGVIKNPYLLGVISRKHNVEEDCHLQACRFFLRGFCAAGEGCRFQHGITSSTTEQQSRCNPPPPLPPVKFTPIAICAVSNLLRV